MAPELRKRSGVSDAAQSNGTAKNKRKVIEDTCTVSPKKHKSTTKTIPGSKEKPFKSSKPVQKTKTGPDEALKVSESEDSDDENEQAQTLALEIDSDDDDDDQSKSTFKSGQDVGKVPKVPKQLVEQSNKASKGEPGVIYIGHIPHGFYEHEMKQYFSQFGPITRLRLSRNKKTGASKHFAFLEFAEASTADIVAKTMDNYLLFGHILKCKTIPKESVHKDLFKGANKRFKPVPWNKMAGKQLEKPLSSSQWADKVKREQNKREKKLAKLAAMDYGFEAPSIKDIPDVPMIENGDDHALDATKAEAEQAGPVREETAEMAMDKKSRKDRTGSKTKKGKA